MRRQKFFGKMLTAVAVATVMVASLALVGCGGDANPSTSASSGSSGAQVSTATEVKKVGIIQLLEHTALSQAREGFVAALADSGYTEGDNLTLNVQIGSGDVSNLSTIADQLIAEKNDLILAIATPSAQAVAGKTTSIPILGTAITDYQVAGLVDSDDMPGRNVSGTTDMNPVEEQIGLLKQLAPDAKTVGFVYSSNEDNSRLQIEVAKQVCDQMGLAYEEVTVANSNDVQQAITAIVGKVDAIYLPTDNVLASTMGTVSSVANAARIPVICGEQGMVENGGLATMGINYYDLGYQTCLMAVSLFKGADIQVMPVEKSTQFDYYINGDVTKEIGIEIPNELQQYVHMG